MLRSFPSPEEGRPLILCIDIFIPHWVISSSPLCYILNILCSNISLKKSKHFIDYGCSSLLKRCDPSISFRANDTTKCGLIQVPLPYVQPGAKVEAEAKVEFKAKVGGRADGLTRGEGGLCRALGFDSEGESRP